jgi:hypothetical protein
LPESLGHGVAENGFAEIIGQRLPRPPQEGTPAHPTLADFELAIADATVVPEQIGCSNEASEWHGARLVSVVPGRLLTNYGNSGFAGT